MWGELGSAFVRRSAVGIFINVSRQRRHLAGSLASCQGGNGEGRVSRDGRGRAMGYSPLLEKLDVLVLRHVCSHPLSLSLCSLSCRSSSRHLKRKFTLSATKRRRRDDDSTETSATTMFGGQPPRSSRQRGSKRKTRQRRALDALPPLHKCSRRSLGSGRNTCGARKAAGNPSRAPSRSPH